MLLLKMFEGGHMVDDIMEGLKVPKYFDRCVTLVWDLHI